MGRSMDLFESLLEIYLFKFQEIPVKLTIMKEWQEKIRNFFLHAFSKPVVGCINCK